MPVDDHAPDEPTDRPPGNRGTALVIENHLILRNTLVGLLEGLGYDAREASNGFSGLRLARQLAPRLLVLDLALPELPGPELLAELRADPATARMPVLIVTGFPGQLTASGRHERLLPKPFSYEAFVAAVEDLDRRDGHVDWPL